MTIRVCDIEIRTCDEPLIFSPGDPVRKIKGYEYPGSVVSAFHTLAGKARYVVESAVAPGMLHIFNGEQLEEDSSRKAAASEPGRHPEKPTLIEALEILAVYLDGGAEDEASGIVRKAARTLSVQEILK